MSQINMNKISYNEGKEKTNLFMYFILALSLILLSICSVLIIGKLKTGQIAIDAKAISYVYSIRNVELSKFAIAITKTGNPVSIAIITMIIISVFYFFKKKQEAIFYLTNILGIWILNESIKAIFKRQRPDVVKLVHASGYSFPSGHSMVFMTAVLILIFLITNYIKNRHIVFILSTIIIVYAFIVGISRVYVGVHYLSDVLSGWTFAAIWSLISILIYKKIKIDSKAVMHYNSSNIKN